MYKDCDNFSRLYYTNSITSDSTNVTISIPNCVKNNFIFFLKINQTVPTGTLPVYISTGNNTNSYPLLDINGTQITSNMFKLNSVLLIAKVCTSGTCCSTLSEYMLVNFTAPTTTAP